MKLMKTLDISSHQPSMKAGTAEATMTETEVEMTEEVEGLRAAVEALVVGKNGRDRETATPVSQLPFEALPFYPTSANTAINW